MGANEEAQAVTWLFQGWGNWTVGLTIIRVSMGLFFMISGLLKLAIPARHESLVKTLRQDGIPFIVFCEWAVPTVEFLGGMALIIGLFSPLAAFGLFVIAFVACCVDGRYRVPGFEPINRADTLADYLYLPETLYAIMLLLIMLAGGGPWSVDRWLLTHHGSW